MAVLLLDTALYTMDRSAERSERGRSSSRTVRIDPDDLSSIDPEFIRFMPTNQNIKHTSMDDLYSIDPEFKRFLNTESKKADIPEVPTQQMNTHKHKKHSTGCIPGFNAMRAMSIAVQYYFTH